MKNAIFQYMVVNEKLDQERGRVPEDPKKDRTRSQLYLQCSRASADSFAAYADLIGVDHYYTEEQVYTKGDDRPLSLMFECLRVIYDPMFDQYDKVLFADTDIIVNTTENIFDQCEDGEVWGVLESDFVTNSGGGYNVWDYGGEAWGKWYDKFSQHEIPLVPVFSKVRPSRITILNTGIVVWSREARLRAREVFMDWQEWAYAKPAYHLSIMNDQPYISGQLMKHDFDLVTLDQTWNDSPHYDDEEEYFDVAKMCHYTGGGGKIIMLDHIERKKHKNSVLGG